MPAPGLEQHLASVHGESTTEAPGEGTADARGDATASAHGEATTDTHGDELKGKEHTAAAALGNAPPAQAAADPSLGTGLKDGSST